MDRLGIGYMVDIYNKINTFKPKLRYPEKLTDRDVYKLFGLAKQAKMLNEKNWVFWQDPRTPNGAIYELFPGKRSYHSYFSTKSFIL